MAEKTITFYSLLKEQEASCQFPITRKLVIRNQPPVPVDRGRVGLPTPSLQMKCSTTELTARILYLQSSKKPAKAGLIKRKQALPKKQTPFGQKENMSSFFSFKTDLLQAKEIIPDPKTPCQPPVPTKKFDLELPGDIIPPYGHKRPCRATGCSKSCRGKNEANGASQRNKRDRQHYRPTQLRSSTTYRSSPEKNAPRT